MLKYESGNALVMMAFILSLLIGLTGLVVDGGRLYLQKGELQKAVDAAALSGVQKLLKGQAQVIGSAVELSEANGVPLASGNITISSDSVEIHNTKSVEMTFAKILGFSSVNVSASSKAMIDRTRGLKSYSNVIPVGIPRDKLIQGAIQTIHFTSDEGKDGPAQGNFGFLAIEGRGAEALENSIVNGVKVEVTPGSFVTTEPGLNWGKVREGFITRINMDVSNSKCNQLSTATLDCSRVAILPIAKDFGVVNGRGKVEVEGFAAFYIERVEPIGGDKSIKGYFLDTLGSGEFSEEIENFGISSIKLVN